jgi:hypothetical protein
MSETKHRDDGCFYAGPGRGDCEHFIDLPGKHIPGQHDGPYDTVDVYGKPNGWCWFCWHEFQLQKLRQNNAKLLAACELSLERLTKICNELGIKASPWLSLLEAAVLTARLETAIAEAEAKQG